ncbi:MAG: hypothetical protein PHS77_10520 [Gallionellaceae bacterium]|nr:hypothetical protein [Gallionellaceae bacterium]
MKSVALLVWLLSANGGDSIVHVDHLDDMAACQAKAAEVSAPYLQEGRRTRHLCQQVVEEVGGVDENGNPL